MAEADAPFLKRWSRRKLEGGPEDAAPAALPETAGPAPADGRPAEIAGAADGAPGVDLSQLPDVETLTADSDFTGFLRDGVPEDLKRLALRALWRSSPVYNIRDGLDDYDEDYTIVEGAGELIKSAWRPGRGYADDPPEAAQEASPEAIGEQDAALGEDCGEEAPEAAAGETEDEPEIAENTDENSQNPHKPGP